MEYDDENSDEEYDEYKLLNYIPRVYDEIDKFYLSIDKIWDDVFVPYIEDLNEHQVLTKLTVDDKYKFVHFMMNNCESFQRLLIINNHANSIATVIENTSDKQKPKQTMEIIFNKHKKRKLLSKQR
jgi:hypothetical protein